MVNLRHRHAGAGRSRRHAAGAALDDATARLRQVLERQRELSAATATPAHDDGRAFYPAAQFIGVCTERDAYSRALAAIFTALESDDPRALRRTVAASRFELLGEPPPSERGHAGPAAGAAASAGLPPPPTFFRAA